jgi:hypothetical protein
MSFVALLNESMPHMFASLLTHVLATAWSGFQISNTAVFKANFKRMITDGACDGVTLLPDYWDDRARLEYPILALNVVSLIISAFLTWKLVKVSLSSLFPDLFLMLGYHCEGFRLANLQARRRLSQDQPHLQACPHTLNRHSAVILLHRCDGGIVAGQPHQRNRLSGSLVRSVVQGNFDCHPCRAYSVSI